jgi:hypothetical protein
MVATAAADSVVLRAGRAGAAHPRLRGARRDEGDLHDRSGHARPVQLSWVDQGPPGDRPHIGRDRLTGCSSCTTLLDSTPPDASTRGACTLIPAIAVRYRRRSLRAQLNHGENPRSARTFSAMRICCWRVASLGSGA